MSNFVCTVVMIFIYSYLMEFFSLRLLLRNEVISKQKTQPRIRIHAKCFLKCEIKAIFIIIIHIKIRKHLKRFLRNKLERAEKPLY